MSKRVINIIIFAISAIIMASLIPTNGMFRYDFVQGEEWSDKTLFAPYDFPISKTTDEYKADMDTFEAQYLPVYHLDTMIRKEALAGLQQFYAITDSELTPAVYRSLTQNRKRAVTIYHLLQEIYNNGIIDNNGSQNNGQIVRIINGDKIESKSRATIFDRNTAREKIRKELLAASLLQNETIHLSEAEQFIVPDILFDDEINKYILKEESSHVLTTKGFIKKGKTLIEKGEIVTQEKFELLNSFKKEHYRLGGRDFSLIPFFGNLLFVVIVLSLSYFSLYAFNREFLLSVRNVLFLMLLYIGLMVSSVIVINIPFYPLSIYLVPFAIFPFYINNFYGSKVSIYQYIFVLLIASMITSSPFEFLMLNYLAGVAGMYILQRAYQRNNFFWAVIITLLVYIVLYTILSLIQDGDVTQINWRRYVWFAINSILLVALYQLIYVIEKVFKFVSSITLVELSDTNQKLLLDLALQAPGTFQHSMQVANLCESAAKAIGANHLLARTGAMYHDIGKSLNAMMFIENNNGVSLHTKMTELQSAEIIRQHVADGVKQARKNNIPKEIIDFIATHHGDS
ncbi:MAG: HDIG domain-containing protein, partial [Rikenellaceae bacterium]